MNADELKTVSTEDLNKKYRELRSITYFLTSVVVLGMAASIYLSITGKKLEYSVLALIPMALILMQNFKKMKVFKAELNSRNP